MGADLNNELAARYGDETTATYWLLTNPLEGRRAETHDQHPVENGDNGDKL